MIKNTKFWLLVLMPFVAGTAWAAFSEPGCGPTGCNTAEPINISGSPQTKAGDLHVGGMTVGNGFALLAGNLLLKMPGFGANKVLTSNDDGLATWQTPVGGPGGSSFWAASSNPADIHNTNSGRVGIGASNPGEQLEVADTDGNNDVRINLRANSSSFGQLGMSSSQMFVDTKAKPFYFYTQGVPTPQVGVESNGNFTVRNQLCLGPANDCRSTWPSGGGGGDSFPSGSIVMTTTTCPNGWSADSNFNARFLIGSDAQHPAGTKSWTPRTGTDYSKTIDAEGPFAVFALLNIGAAASAPIHSHPVPSIAVTFCVKN